MRLSANDAAGEGPSAGPGISEPAAFLEMAGVAKQFGPTAVLHDIDLAIGEQEFVCLLGPSGCGKTTLLRILCGIEVPSAGRIRLRGEDITDLPAARRRFGVVFQSYALFPNLTALENVAYGLTDIGRARRDARAREMLELVGLAGHADRFPAQLSGGQQQRVALARALAPQPSLLLLDEPLSALDAQVRHTLRTEIRAIQQRLRVPVVMVTHDQDEALAMADRVVLMNGGRIEQADTPHALYARPNTEFAARFVGRINLLPAHSAGGGLATVGRSIVHLPQVRTPARHLTLALRPGHVQLQPYDHTAARAPQAAVWPPNRWPAVVQSRQFSGAWIGLTLEVPALDATLEAEILTPPGMRAPWAEGDRCVVYLAPEALHVLPE